MAIEISKIIEDWVPNNSKVIDFGCGDGSLLFKLKKDKIRPISLGPYRQKCTSALYNKMNEFLQMD